MILDEIKEGAILEIWTKVKKNYFFHKGTLISQDQQFIKINDRLKGELVLNKNEITQLQEIK